MLVPQALPARTVTDPATVPHFTVMAFVPDPAVMLAPVGTVQLYVLTPVTAGVVYDSPVADGQTEAGPLIDAGVEGRRLKVSVLAVLDPQLLLATTDMEPLLKAVLMFTTTEVPLLLVMLQPEGTVQL